MTAPAMLSTLLTLDGAPVQTYRYSAFGELHESIGNIENPWRFSSKRFDSETGFYEFGRRYYFPEIGRWTTPDPAGFEDGENLYAYVHNSPLTHIDPDGRFAFLIPIAINIALSMAAEYALPTAIATLEQYYGGAVAASLLSGVVKGYNGSYSGNFSHDASLGLCEKAGMAIGTVLSYSPSKITANTAKKIAASELSGRAVNFAASKGARAVEWFSKNTARQSAKKVVKTSAQKTAEVAARKGVVNTASKRGVAKQLDLDALSKAGQVMDRGGLTKAGRALDKHGNRIGSPFPKAIGNSVSKNRLGQFHLDDILTSPGGFVKSHGQKGIKIYSPNGRGVHFTNEGTFKGFVELRYE